MSSKPHLILADETVSIASPLPVLFAFLSNHENYSRWFPGALAVISEDGLPHGTVGKVYREPFGCRRGATGPSTSRWWRATRPIGS